MSISGEEIERSEIDDPIYLHFLDLYFDDDRMAEPQTISRYRYYVIEETNTPIPTDEGKITPISTAVSDELPQDQMMTPTVLDRVRLFSSTHLDYNTPIPHLHYNTAEETITPISTPACDEMVIPPVLDRVSHLTIPHLDYKITYSLFSVCKSHMFFMGGRTFYHHRGVSVPNNGILSIALYEQDASWDRCDNWTTPEFDVWPLATVVRHDEVDGENDLIYVIMGEQILRFDPYYVEETGEIIDFPFRWPAHMIASNGTEMLIYDQLHNQLVSFDMYSLNTKVINPSCLHPCETWLSHEYMTQRNVMIGRFVVSFAEYSPLNGKYSPALYVYDTSVDKWLTEPVQGLKNDGFILPFPEREARVRFQHGSLVRVRRKVDKLALVWAWDIAAREEPYYNRAEVHWSKFILNTEDSTCFHIEDLQSGICSATAARLIHCTAG